MTNIEIKGINKETIEIYKACFDLNGSQKKEEDIRWRFLENPINNQIVEIAFDIEKNKTAAIYAISNVKFKVDEKELIGTQSIDAITDIV